jgi:hypothetical protein
MLIRPRRIHRCIANCRTGLKRGKHPSSQEVVTEFAHRMRGKVQFSEVTRRISTSIALLTALLAGTISPMAVCALRCERHSRAEIHHHCSQDSDSMLGMTHDDSAMRHTPVGDVARVVKSQSCQSHCAKAEGLNISRKVVPQVTVVQTGAVVLDATEFLAPHLESAWSLDSGPPSLPSAYTAFYSILRI